MSRLLSNPLFMAGMGFMQGRTPQPQPVNTAQNLLQSMQTREKFAEIERQRKMEEERMALIRQYTSGIQDPQLRQLAQIAPEAVISGQIQQQFAQPPNMMTDVQKNALALGLVPGTQAFNDYVQSVTMPKSDVLSPEALDQRLALSRARATGTRISYDADGRPVVEMGPGVGGNDDTRSTVSNVEKNQQTAIQTLNDLQAVGDRYQDEFLTYSGKARGALATVKDKAGLSSEGDQQFLAQKTQFDTAVDRMFNAYRKEITGAAASVQELDRLKKTMLNTDMSPAQFRAAYNDFVAITRQQLALNTQLKQQGLSDSEIAQRLDDAFYMMTDKPVTKGQQAQDVIDWSAL